MRLKRLPILICLPAVMLSPGCGQRPDDSSRQDSLRTEVVNVAQLKPQVTAFCGDCHLVPHPETFPREAWRREVERGFRFYHDSGRQDLAAPAVEDVVSYYEALSPKRLVVPPPQDSSSDGGAAKRFRRQTSDAPQLEPPAVSFLEYVALPHVDQERLLFCDMRSGMVGLASLSPETISVESLTTLKNPSRAALCDLDGDGSSEIVIAELGSFTSEDHRRGAIVWLDWQDSESTWRKRLLVSGLGRVADVRCGDFDADGDEDLAVAEFGHLLTGRVLIYENLGREQGMPRLREHVIDKRHGAIHVPVADLNGDGRLDFVALVSQEYEVIEAYLNSGDFQFQRKTILPAGDPAYGSSGIQLVDLDADGDSDVLYSNGDTFGSDYLKPYHGIRWLENRGGYPFIEHELTHMVGVQRALAAELDGDGDLDVVAAGFLPHNLVTAPELAGHSSLVWLEQTQPGQFVRHSLESMQFLHAGLAVGDFDHDHDIDLAVGNFQDLEGPHQPWLSIWWNTERGKRPVSRVDSRRSRDNGRKPGASS